jgi:hypothetical protein
MSCGSGNGNGSGNGTFAPLNDTWTRQASLNFGKWDPYPNNQIINEGFQGCAMYNDNIQNVNRSAPIPNMNNNLGFRNIQATKTIVPQIESFTNDQRYFKEYLNLNQTWGRQKQFDL